MSDNLNFTSEPFNIQDAIGLTVQGERLSDGTIQDVKIESLYHCFGRHQYAVINPDSDDPFLVNYYRLAAAVNGEEVDAEVEAAFINTTVEEKQPWATKRLRKSRVKRVVRNLNKWKTQQKKLPKQSP